MLFEKISELCEARGISIAKLESECGLGNATVRRWNKSMPRLGSIQRVADYLKVSINDLLTPESVEEGGA